MNTKVAWGFVLGILLLPMTNVSAADAGSGRDLPVIKTHEYSVKPRADKSIWIPEKLLISRDEIPGVYVLQDNEARFRMVLPGKHAGKDVEILSGLFGDEELLSDGLDAMHDGSPVDIIR